MKTLLTILTVAVGLGIAASSASAGVNYTFHGDGLSAIDILNGNSSSERR